MTEKDLVEAHKTCIRNKEAILASENVGCFYCTGVFPPNRVVEYVDGGRTGICPICAVDALLPSSSGFPVSDPRFLRQMHLKWFTPRQEE